MNLLHNLNSANLTFSKNLDNDSHITADLVIAIIDNERQLEILPSSDYIRIRINHSCNIFKSAKGYCTQLPNIKGTIALIKGNIENRDLYFWLKDFSKLLKEINIGKIKDILFIATYATKSTLNESIRTLLAHTEQMPNFKNDLKFQKTNINIISNYSKENFSETIAKNKGNSLARRLTILPTNYLNPQIYIKNLEYIAEQNNWKIDIYNKQTLKEMGAGLFSAVARASRTAGIVKLTYMPPSNVYTHNTISLVGKGVCFDTGGVNLKPSKHIYDMNDDMMGSAVALGSLLALSTLKVPHKVQAYLAITNNNIGETAFLPNEVVTALNGKSIEIVDTDAEGRMILADTLCLASQDNPKLIIDYATLTGAAVRALGTEYSAIFTNKEDWQRDLLQYGQACAEKVWSFPMDEHYLENLSSDIADLKQCCISGYADHILAAKFLQQFVDEDIRWLHMDLSSCRHKGGLAPIPTEISGVGVWYTCELIKKFFNY